MRIEYIQEFKELTKKLSFQETAKLLNITQPALSNHIKAIEDELGVILFDRSKGSQPQLTKAGKVFLNGCGKLLTQYESLVDECRKAAATKTDRIIITLPFLIEKAAEYLMNETRLFMRAHNEVEVILSSGSFDRNPLDELLAGDIDCCLYPFIKDTDYLDQIEIIPLHSEEVVVWLDAQNPLAALEKIPLGALSAFNLVLAMNEKASLAGRWTHEFFVDSHEPRVIDYYAESFDDFVLNAFSPQEIAFFTASYQNYPTIQIRSDRIMKPLDPQLFTDICAVFRKYENNQATLLFQKQLLNAKDSE